MTNHKKFLSSQIWKFTFQDTSNLQLSVFHLAANSTVGELDIVSYFHVFIMALIAVFPGSGDRNLKGRAAEQ